MDHIAIYFTGDIDPDTNNIRMELVERPVRDEAAPLIVVLVPEPANADPTLAAFYELPDQGDGK